MNRVTKVYFKGESNWAFRPSFVHKTNKNSECNFLLYLFVLSMGKKADKQTNDNNITL
jgi:hypothetical protein